MFLVFRLIWYFDPSSLQLISVLGMTMILIDFTIPLIGPSMFSGQKWWELWALLLMVSTLKSADFSASCSYKGDRSRKPSVPPNTAFWKYFLKNLVLKLNLFLSQLSYEKMWTTLIITLADAIILILIQFVIRNWLFLLLQF